MSPPHALSLEPCSLNDGSRHESIVSCCAPPLFRISSNHQFRKWAIVTILTRSLCGDKSPIMRVELVALS